MIARPPHEVIDIYALRRGLRWGTLPIYASPPGTGGAGSPDRPLLAPPTLSREGFRLLLAGKPEAQAEAGAMWGDCIAAAVDPGVAAAFALHEHSLRWLGLAALCLSWGNLRPGASWTGRVYSRVTSSYYTTKEDAARARAGDLFRVYPTYRAGLQDYCRLMRVYALDWGYETVAEAVPVYAPASDDNDEAAYIESVNGAVALWESRYRGGVMYQQGSFVATTRQGINVRSGPGDRYAIVREEPAGKALPCSAHTKEGATYTASGISSSTWLVLADGTGYVTGHPDYTAYALPPTIEDMRAQLEAETAARKSAEAARDGLVAKARATKAMRPTATVTVAQLLGIPAE